jgi:hypothetical protein
MQRYSINKVGKDFVVQAGDESVFKCASRRKAARIVSDANDLMRARGCKVPGDGRCCSDACDRLDLPVVEQGK